MNNPDVYDISYISQIRKGSVIITDNSKESKRKDCESSFGHSIFSLVGEW